MALTPRCLLWVAIALPALAGCAGQGERSLYSLLTGTPDAATPAAAPAPAEPPAEAAAPEPTPRRPFVTVRAISGDLAVDAGFAGAIRTAREARPEAGFEVVAVAPRPADWAMPAAAASAAADRQTEQVLRALRALGVPPERIALTGEFQRELAASEVRVFLR